MEHGLQHHIVIGEFFMFQKKKVHQIFQLSEIYFRK